MLERTGFSAGTQVTLAKPLNFSDNLNFRGNPLFYVKGAEFL